MVGEAEQAVAGVRQTHMSFEWSDGTGKSDFNNLLGKLVRITGLTGRPELNGRLGAFSYIAYTTSAFASTQCVHKSSACIVSYRSTLPACLPWHAVARHVQLARQCFPAYQARQPCHRIPCAGRVYSWHEEKGRAGVMLVQHVELRVRATVRVRVGAFSRVLQLASPASWGLPSTHSGLWMARRTLDERPERTERQGERERGCVMGPPPLPKSRSPSRGG